MRTMDGKHGNAEESPVMREYKRFTDTLDGYLEKGHRLEAICFALREERYACAKHLMKEHGRNLRFDEQVKIGLLLLQLSHERHKLGSIYNCPFLELARRYVNYWHIGEQLQRTARTFGLSLYSE